MEHRANENMRIARRGVDNPPPTNILKWTLGSALMVAQFS
jgi:hypothetical protein